MLNSLLLGIVGVCYALAGLNYFCQGNKGMALAFVCYAIANVGLYYAGGGH